MSSCQAVGNIYNYDIIFSADIQLQVSNSVFELMKELWINWSHIGVSDENKIENIGRLVDIEKELHKDVLNETKSKLKVLEAEVEALKKETQQVGDSLGVKIPVLDNMGELTLYEYKALLDVRIRGFRDEVQKRRKQIEKISKWQQDLVDKLGVTIDDLQDTPLPSDDDLAKRQQHLEMLEAEKQKRMATYQNKRLAIKEIIAQLRLTPRSKFELMVLTTEPEDFKVTDLNMDRLAKIHQEFQENYTCTNNRVLELREKLTKLWDTLDEDPEYRISFLQKHPGCHLDTEMDIREEISRCNQIKMQKMGVFITNVRNKIKEMWELCMYSQEQRNQFFHFNNGQYCESLLKLHNLYLESLECFYTTNKPIFDMLETRKNLWSKMIELEAKASEPGRFHNRGGQLLREEKERKAIATKLPKIEACIQELVEEYEKVKGEKFTIYGKPVLDIMQNDWLTRKQERTNKLSARKQAPAQSTSSLRSFASSPLGKRTRTAANSTGRPPAAKRQMVTPSTVSSCKGPHMSRNVVTVKQTAATTARRSGRLTSRVVAEKAPAKRVLNYEETLTTSAKKTPKVNASILKHKRTPGSSRRSNRRSKKPTDELHAEEDLLSYTLFKNSVDKCEPDHRSSVMPRLEEPNMTGSACGVNIVRNLGEKQNNGVMVALTPKGKENVQHYMMNTPKVSNKLSPFSNNLMNTPTNRLTRSSLRLNAHEPEYEFGAPRTPLSASKTNIQRQPMFNATPKTPSGFQRSKTSSHIIRAKNLPPLI